MQINILVYVLKNKDKFQKNTMNKKVKKPCNNTNKQNKKKKNLIKNHKVNNRV